MPGVVPASDQWKSIDAAAALSKRYSGEPMPKRLVSEMGCVMVVFASWLGGQKNFGGKESWIFSNTKHSLAPLLMIFIRKQIAAAFGFLWQPQ